MLAGASPRTVGDQESYEAAWTRELAHLAERDRLDGEFAAAEEQLVAGDQASQLAFSVAYQRITRRREQISEELSELRAERLDLRTNPSRQKPVPDDVAIPEPVDFDEIDMRMRNGGRTTSRPTHRIRRQIRDWISPREWAYVLTGDRANTGSSVRRWMDHGLPSTKPYWEATRPPFHEFARKRRALLVSGLNIGLLDDEQRDRLFTLLAADPPEGWDSYPRRVES